GALAVPGVRGVPARLRHGLPVAGPPAAGTEGAAARGAAEDSGKAGALRRPGGRPAGCRRRPSGVPPAPDPEAAVRVPGQGGPRPEGGRQTGQRPPHAAGAAGTAAGGWGTAMSERPDVPRLVPDEPLPPYAFVPGRCPHPVSDPAGHSFNVPRERPAPPDPEDWAACRPYLVGIDL